MMCQSISLPKSYVCGIQHNIINAVKCVLNMDVSLIP